jgi:16S rRNA (adenine1518-N6/adenine1519-N6)-dimethyltransferase
LFTPFCDQRHQFPAPNGLLRNIHMTLSHIRAALREIRLSPAKRLGQNFLHDQNLARWIVDQAEVTPEDYVLEIGPGLGALTRFILEKGARVLAIEKDTRLANFLRERFTLQRLEVLNIDALEFDPRSLFGYRKVKLIANLPYSVSSALLLKFLQQPSSISLWLLMLQKEVAARLSASPCTHDYGTLTLHVQLHHHVKYLRRIAATVFFPRPEVDSAMVRLLPRDPLELPPRDDQLLLKLIRVGFSQRRKQLGKLLREYVPDWETISHRLNLNQRARAEELSLAQWIALTNLIAPPPHADAIREEQEQFPVVDKNDQVVRSASRSEVHGNNLLHRAVHILLFNQSGEVYLQQRSRSKDRHPLKWDSSVAGHVTTGENYDDTARREVREELGISVPLHRLVKLPASERTDHEFVWLYDAAAPGDLVPNRAEIEQGAFLLPAAVDGWTSARPEDFTPAFLECWSAYRRKTGTDSLA